MMVQNYHLISDISRRMEKKVQIEMTVQKSSPHFGSVKVGFTLKSFVLQLVIDVKISTVQLVPKIIYCKESL